MADLPNYNYGDFWIIIGIAAGANLIIFLVLWFCICVCDFDRFSNFEKRRKKQLKDQKKEEKKS